MGFKFESLDVWKRSIDFKEKAYFFRISKGSIYEVVSLLVMVGKRGKLERDAYRSFYTEANEIAAMLTSIIRQSY